MQKMEIKQYLAERKLEHYKKIKKAQLYKDTFDQCWVMLEDSMIRNHDRVTPKFTRRVEMLEALMYGFLTSADDLDSLNFAERMVFDLVGSG